MSKAYVKYIFKLYNTDIPVTVFYIWPVSDIIYCSSGLVGTVFTFTTSRKINAPDFKFSLLKYFRFANIIKIMTAHQPFDFIHLLKLKGSCEIWKKVIQKLSKFTILQVLISHLLHVSCSIYTKYHTVRTLFTDCFRQIRG